jgi:hypothetical protein
VVERTKEDSSASFRCSASIAGDSCCNSVLEVHGIEALLLARLDGTEMAWRWPMVAKQGGGDRGVRVGEMARGGGEVEDDFSTVSAREVIRVDPRRAVVKGSVEAGGPARTRPAWARSVTGPGSDLKKQCS